MQTPLLYEDGLLIKNCQMVYVGKREYKYGRMIMSHMVADTLIELHEMAQTIGIQKKYFQDKKGKPHYDVCKEKKMEAIALGANEVDDRKIIELYRMLNNKKMIKEQMPEPMFNSTTTDATTSVSPACTKPPVVKSLVSVQDLRIGNFVYGVNEYQGTALPICSLHYDNTLRLLVGEKSSIGCFSANEITPIDLDKEWLEIFGFKQRCILYGKKYVEYYDHSKLTICNWGNGFTMINAFAHGIRIELKYVHQLQNLFFAALYKELECIK